MKTLDLKIDLLLLVHILSNYIVIYIVIKYRFSHVPDILTFCVRSNSCNTQYVNLNPVEKKKKYAVFVKSI